MKRTIVIGDVHACPDEVRDLFAKIALTKEDRVIFVGDLIHRGPKDREAVELAMEHESLLGNHERWALNQRAKPIEQLAPHHRQAMEELEERHWEWFAKRPLFLLLPEFGAAVVHAGCYPGIPVQCQPEKALLHLQCCKPGVQKTYWPSEVPNDGEYKFWTNFWDGPERVIFGHTHLTKPLLTEKVCGLDTGVVHGRFLSAVILPSWEIVQVPARRTYFGDRHLDGFVDKPSGRMIRLFPVQDGVECFSG